MQRLGMNHDGNLFQNGQIRPFMVQQVARKPAGFQQLCWNYCLQVHTYKIQYNAENHFLACFSQHFACKMTKIAEEAKQVRSANMFGEILTLCFYFCQLELN